MFIKAFIAALLATASLPLSSNFGQAWEPVTNLTTPPLLPGFPLTLNGALNGSDLYLGGVTTFDLNGDGMKEIIFGNRRLSYDGKSYACGGRVYAIRPNGAVLWVTNVRGDVMSTPAVGYLNGSDQHPVVVVGMGAYHYDGETAANECGKNNPASDGNGGVVGIDGLTGSILWTFNTQDRAEWGAAEPNGVLDGVISSPAIGNILPNDPYPQVVVGSWDNCVYLIKHDGTAAWGMVPFNYSDPKFVNNSIYGSCGNHGFFNHDTVWSSPAIADIDGDGHPDIIIGGDSTEPNYYGMPSGGVIWVIKYDGSVIASKWFDQAMYTSPAVVDLDHDGRLEIVVGSGDAYVTHGRYIKALNYDGTKPGNFNPYLDQRLVVKWSTPTVGPVFSSPAIADINLDGALDVVAVAKVGDSLSIGPSLSQGSFVYTIDGKTGTPLPGFPVHLCEMTGRSFPDRASPVIADIIGDEHPEILVSHAREIDIIKSDGTYYNGINQVSTYQCAPFAKPAGDTTLVFGRIDNYSGSFYSNIAVDNLSGSTTGIIAVGRYGEDSGYANGELYVWSGFKNSSKPWPMFRHDAQHSGFFYNASNFKAGHFVWLPILYKP